MCVPRRKIQALLRDWLRVDLSTSTINQCLHEAGRAVEPVVETQLIPQLTASDLLHIDETPWKPWEFIAQMLAARRKSQPPLRLTRPVLAYWEIYGAKRLR